MEAAILASFLNFLKSVAWVLAPAILILIFFEVWLFYRRLKYINSLVWKTLEVKIPKTVIKGPKAMEQIFTALHATYSFGILFWDKWFKGKVEDWMSVEIVGRAHGVHFYIRLQESYQNLVESSIYAQYPDAEIIEVQDYTDQLPPALPNKTYDVWGTDFVLVRENGYPILTYPNFEEPGKIEEERRIDPIANITEVMSNLKESEAIWLQFLIRPTGDAWKKEAEALIDDLSGKKATPKRGIIESFVSGLGEFVANLIAAPLSPPVWAVPGEAKPALVEQTSSKRHLVDAIQNKISKFGFESVLRFVYIDKRDSFTRSNIVAVIGGLRQFGTQNLNAFKPNLQSMTIAKGLFKKSKLMRKKQFLYSNYRIRHFPKRFMVLNTEELATVYHFPITGVKAALLQRIESKRGGPPPELPIQI